MGTAAKRSGGEGQHGREQTQPDEDMPKRVEVPCAAGSAIAGSAFECGVEDSQGPGLVLSCLLTLYTAVMSFEILFPFGLWVSEPGWLLNHSQLV